MLRTIYVVIWFSSLFFCSIFAEAEEIYDYRGIPGCCCFKNCGCDTKYGNPFENYNRRSQNDYENHFKKKSNATWHFFLDKLKESWNGGPSVIYLNYLFCLDSRKFNMLSEYLNAVEEYKITMKNEAKKSITFYQKQIDKINGNFLHRDLKEIEKLNEEINKINKSLAHSLKVLSGIPNELVPLYQQILASCPHQGSQNLGLTYNEGLLAFVTGKYENALEKINEFVVFAQSSEAKKNLLNSQIYQMQGESLIEVGLYHEAIAVLTQSIEEKLRNSEAYINRAAAYFEIGDFDLAVTDYLSSQTHKGTTETISTVSNEFSIALINAILDGGRESAIEFVPSLCNTAFGLGECLWSFVQEPQQSTTNFCNACYEAGNAVKDYIRGLDQEKIEELAAEVLLVYEKFNDLNDTEKGQAIGYCLGKYGVDILAGGATIKCVSAIKKLKQANQICNLEVMSTSESNREAMRVIALKHAADRESFFKNVKIQWDRQNKHIMGKHNYDPGRGIITLEDNYLEEIIKKNVGKGQKATDSLAFAPGYRERIDFGEIIGDFAFIKSDTETIFLPTTRGILHYSKEGVHLVPSAPHGFRK